MSVHEPMPRDMLIAAEIYGYSYTHYAEHLGSGHVRFETLMPEVVRVLARAEQEHWGASRVADALGLPEDDAQDWQARYQQAAAIVDAPSLAQSFLRGVRASIEQALDEGLGDDASIDALVEQIGYRAADLGFRLDEAGERLSTYSEELRHLPPLLA